ncbi:MAG: type II toxin-antitoxin system RelE/ParE family toxin [Fimbriimonadaceae bacterium]
MATGKPSLRVTVSAAVSVALKQIWWYDASHRGLSQANRYEMFLRKRIGLLATDYDRGRPVGADPNLRYQVLKLRSKGDGHVIVYRVDLLAKEVDLLHIFHTKQDWREKLDNEA